MSVSDHKILKAVFALSVILATVTGAGAAWAQQAGDAEALERARALSQQPAAVAPEPAPMPVAAEKSQPKSAPTPDAKLLLPAEDASQSADAPAVAPEEETVPVPELQELAAPVEQPSAPTLPRPDSTAGTEVPAIPESQNQEFDENLFFDAESLVPAGEISKKGAPSKVDPSVNPGSVLVVSTKTASAESRDAQLIAADRARKLGRYESALQIYDTLYDKDKRDPNVLMGRASALQSLGRVDEAIQAYERLLDIRPKNVEAQVNMQGLVGKHYPAVALRNLQDLYQDNPGNVGVIAQMAVMEAQLGNNAEAVRYLGMAASMEPQNANHLFNMAVIADRAGDKKAAIQYYEDALETDTLYGAGRSIPREAVFERLAQLR